MDETTDTAVIDLHVEVYLKDRDEPLFCPVAFEVSPIAHSTVEDVMDLAAGLLLREIDTVGTHRIVLEDSRYTKRIILLSEVQSISLLAPDKLPWEEVDA